MCLSNANGLIWKIVLTLAFTSIFSSAGWAVLKVTELPKEYITSEKHKEDLKTIENQIDNLEENIVTRQSRMEDKIDEINQFLRNYFSQQKTK